MYAMVCYYLRKYVGSIYVSNASYNKNMRGVIVFDALRVDLV